MTLAPKKFITASDEAIKAIAQRVTAKLKEELAKGTAVVFADVVADAVLADFAGFKSVGLEELKTYAGHGQDHFARLLTDDQGEVILTEKLEQMLQNFRSAADAEGDEPKLVFFAESVSENGDVEQLHPKEEVISEETKNEDQQKTELEEAPNAPVLAPALEVEVQEASVPEEMTIEAPTAQISLAGSMVLASVKRFAEINSKLVVSSNTERASAHQSLKDALFTLFNNFAYNDFNPVYTEVIRLIVAAKNDAFSNDRVLIGVDTMSVQDNVRSAYVALMGVLMHATDAVDDPSIWQYVSILSTFERHAEFNQVARDNVGEYYRHVLRK